MSRKLLSFGLLAVLGSTAVASAQTPFNRKVDAIAVTPDPTTPGVFQISAAVSLTVDAISAPLDLTTQVLYIVNGSTVATEVLDLSASPQGGGGGCAGDCNEPCICHATATQTICACEPFSTITPAVPVPALEPEDEIMVLLMRAAGTPADDDTSDNQLVRHFLGEPMYWNRRIADVQIAPSEGGSGGDQFYDIFIGIDYDARYDGPLNMGFDLDLLVNGKTHTTIPAVNDWLTFASCQDGCGSPCAFDPDGLTIGFCEDPDFSCPCFVFGAQTASILNIPVDPDDELIIILRPVPGALPELPGFDEDDEQDVPRPCLEDLDGDGWVNVTDLLFLLGAWGTPDADIDGDGNTDVTDLLALLARWGACFPV